MCGVRGLERDKYRLTHTNRRGKKGLTTSTFDHKPPEFLCHACGAAFMLTGSMRYEQAIALMAEERKKGLVNRNGR